MDRLWSSNLDSRCTSCKESIRHFSQLLIAGLLHSHLALRNLNITNFGRATLHKLRQQVQLVRPGIGYIEGESMGYFSQVLVMSFFCDPLTSGSHNIST